ncbi:hypothetical protein BB558_002993 [Smittium angustum]|uniref:RRM domain-containing protein n=1 Tax=Smittium angustum TaxID=133377 RepID=A0A2U1J7B3_SMIAN|nr:hypothetical protein BB558_002993 [Smittium angustum]
MPKVATNKLNTKADFISINKRKPQKLASDNLPPHKISKQTDSDNNESETENGSNDETAEAEFLKAIDSDYEENTNSLGEEDEEETEVNSDQKKEIEKLQQVIKKVEKSDTNLEDYSSVIYIGRIPHGFYEDEMRLYFGQFGKIKNLRLSRNRKTGKSKHYAFIEFWDKSVAKIVADTMNNYLLYNRLLKCQLLFKSKVHETLFSLGNKQLVTYPNGTVRNTKFVPINYRKINMIYHNSEKSPETIEKIEARLLGNESKRRTKIQDAGIDYDFPGYSSQRN